MKKALFSLMIGLFLAVPLAASDQAYDFLMAKLAADGGETAKAITILDRLIAADPGNSTLRFEKADILAQASDLKGAEVELRKVVAATPDFVDARKLLGRILFDRARNDRSLVEEALTHLTAAFTLNPDDLNTGMNAAQIYMGLERWADAEKILARLVEESPTNRVINYNYAQVLTRLGRGADARTYLERAIAADPGYRPAVMQLLDIYREAGEFERAAQILEPLIGDEPANLDLQRQQALYHLRAGDPERALERLQALSKASPGDERVLYYYAEALGDLGRHTEAEPIYRQLVDKNPQDADFLTSYALNQLAQRRYDVSTSLFERILTLPALPDNLKTMARTQLSAIDFQQGNYASAARRSSEVLMFSERLNLQAVNIAAESYAREKKYDAGLTMLDGLLARFPGDVLLSGRRLEMLLQAGREKQAAEYAAKLAATDERSALSAADAYARTERFKEALDILTPIAAKKTDDLAIQFQLGAYEERAGRHKEAEKAFLAVLAKDPEHAATLNYLGYMWADRGENLERAADMLNRAVKQEPENGAYVDSLGWAYFRLGKLDLAEKYLNDAARLLPTDATVRQHLGDVLSKRGEKAKAIEIYRTALSLQPDADEEKEIRSKLAKLEERK